MNDTETLLAEYNEWLAERADLAERDGSTDNPPSSGDWQGSDDAGLRLLHAFAALAARKSRSTEMTTDNTNPNRCDNPEVEHPGFPCNHFSGAARPDGNHRLAALSRCTEPEAGIVEEVDPLPATGHCRRCDQVTVWTDDQVCTGCWHRRGFGA